MPESCVKACSFNVYYILVKKHRLVEFVLFFDNDEYLINIKIKNQIIY